MAINLDTSSREDILNSKICDLDISIESSRYSHAIEKLYNELDSKKILVRPRFWLSNEWFSPEGISGIAIPFYLMHPKLIELEKEYIGYAEGENFDEFMKLMRHECGHVMDHAYFLRDSDQRIALFGDHTSPYPSSYEPRVFSRNFVYHLEDHYAQAHPEEDFAETFATWLTPRSNWKKIYADWPAIQKLNFLDSSMKSLRNKKPNIVCYKEVDPISECELSVLEYLQLKRKKLRKQKPSIRSVSHLLGYIEKQDRTCLKIDLAKSLKKNRREIVRNIALKTNQYQYKIDNVVKDLENIASSNGLKTIKKATPKALESIVIRHSNHFFKEGKHRIIM